MTWNKLLNPKTKRVIVLLLLLILVSIVSSFAYLTLKSKNNSNQAETLVSYPTRTPKGYSFDTSKLEVEEINNLRYQCDTDKPELPAIPAKIAEYTYKRIEYSEAKDNLGSTFYYVFSNMSNYLENSRVKGNYEAINMLLQGKATLNTGISDTYNFMVIRSCTSGTTIPTGYIEKINYPNTDSAYLIIFYGSHQSVTDSGYMPLEAYIISNIGDNYAIGEFSMPYDAVTKSNNLAVCEENTQNGYKMIDIFSKEGQKCVESAFIKDLDHTKLNSLVAEFIKVFDLKN